MQEIMTVPANIRTEFDTSKINTGMNNVEEKIKDQQILGDNPYIPTPDERCLNVVQRIKETSTYYKDEESVGNAEFTNVWELKEGVTRSYVIGEDQDQIVYLVSENLKDPADLIGATLINAEGASFTITEIPGEHDGAYIIGNPEIAILMIGASAMEAGGDLILPAGTYTMNYDDEETTVVKIIAKSAIFPVQ